ncbi:MAG: hypothetical protein ACP5JJ_18020, partial [Anaerolineae bacterium]
LGYGPVDAGPFSFHSEGYCPGFANLPDIGVEAILKERKEPPDSLREEVLVALAEDRILRVKTEAPFVTLFQ